MSSFAQALQACTACCVPALRSDSELLGVVVGVSMPHLYQVFVYCHETNRVFCDSVID